MTVRRLIERAQELGPERIETSGGTVVALSWCHPDRAPNQDALLVLDLEERGMVLAVADGMGGHSEGEVAAELALACLADCVEAAAAEERGLRAGILDGFDRAQREVSALQTDAGTTLVAASVHAGRVRTVHAGDSMALLCGGRGKVKHRTLDHSPTGYALEAGLLAEEDALTHADRHVILSAIGHPDLRTDLGPRLALAARDTLLLATDGLTDNLPTEEVVALARRGAPEQAALALAQRARATMRSEPGGIGKRDDLTLLLLRPGAGGAAGQA
jgi:serine/threonine protein phosphatase PrpC